LRALIFLLERYPQKWIEPLKNLLLNIKDKVESAKEKGQTALNMAFAGAPFLPDFVAPLSSYDNSITHINPDGAGLACVDAEVTDFPTCVWRTAQSVRRRIFLAAAMLLPGNASPTAAGGQPASTPSSSCMTPLTWRRSPQVN
jgi:hypothetical protein